MSAIVLDQRGDAAGLKPLAVTVPNAAAISGLGQSTIWAKIADGTLRTTAVGRRRLVIYASLEDLLLPKAA